MRRFIIMLLVIVFYTGYLIFTQLLFGENNLISIEGNLSDDKNVMTSFSTEKGQEIAQLVFMLKKDNRAFTITADITDSPFGSRAFDGVILAIKRGAQIVVSIRKGDLKSLNPKVYQIKVDEKEVFNIIEKPANNSRLYLCLLLLLLLFCSAYYWLQCLHVPIKKSTCKRWTYHMQLTTKSRHFGC